MRSPNSTRRMILARLIARLGPGAARRHRADRHRRAIAVPRQRGAARRRQPGAGFCAGGRSWRADRRHDHRRRRLGRGSTVSRPAISTPIGASRSTSSKSPSRNGRPGSPSDGLVDQATRGALLVEAEIARLERRRDAGPVIIAGSTGTNRATAKLIAAIARAPQGAVVLPDLDQRARRSLLADDRRGGERTHRRPSAGGAVSPARDHRSASART